MSSIPSVVVGGFLVLLVAFVAASCVSYLNITMRYGFATGSGVLRAAWTGSPATMVAWLSDTSGANARFSPTRAFISREFVK